MQTLSQVISHRGAGATLANPRWHPYSPPRASTGGSGSHTSPNYAHRRHSHCSSSSTNSIQQQLSGIAHINTPASTVLSVTPPTSISPPVPGSAFLLGCSPAPSISSTTTNNATVLTAAAQPQPPHPHPSSHAVSSRPAHVQPHPLKANSSKGELVTTVVDQAVKTLSDIWKPEGIPSVFAMSSRVTTAKTLQQKPSLTCLLSRRGSYQLPSPETPNTQQSSPFFPQTSSSTSSPPSSQNATAATNSNATVIFATGNELLPLKTFVHEVLRRSRTSCSVLQTALCYLEAIRHRIPELVELEKSGKGVRGEVDLSERIVKIGSLCEERKLREKDMFDAAAIMVNAEEIFASGSTCVAADDASATATMSTVTVCPLSTGPEACRTVSTDATRVNSDSASQSSSSTNYRRKKLPNNKPLPALPPLPSPLLCPRRMFLASLILASKFLQDRCYSNRAWAKLSGLAPREVGRCERALGDALEWRLWVGKQGAAGALKSEESQTFGTTTLSITTTPPSPTTPTTPTCATTTTTTAAAGVARQITRCKTETWLGFQSPLSDGGSGMSPDGLFIGSCGMKRSPQSLRRASTMPDSPMRVSTFGHSSTATATTASQTMGLLPSFASTMSLSMSGLQPTPKLTFSPGPLSSGSSSGSGSGSESNLDTPGSIPGFSWFCSPNVMSFSGGAHPHHQQSSGFGNQVPTPLSSMGSFSDYGNDMSMSMSLSSLMTSKQPPLPFSLYPPPPPQSQSQQLSQPHGQTYPSSAFNTSNQNPTVLPSMLEAMAQSHVREVPCGRA